MLPPRPITPPDPCDSDRQRLDELAADRDERGSGPDDSEAWGPTCLALSAIAGAIVFLVYIATIRPPFSDCHGGARESLGAAAGIGGGLWLLEIVFTALFRRRLLLLVLVGVCFVALYIAGLAVLAHEASRLWGPERCVP